MATGQSPPGYFVRAGALGFSGGARPLATGLSKGPKVGMGLLAGEAASSLPTS